MVIIERGCLPRREADVTRDRSDRTSFRVSPPLVCPFDSASHPRKNAGVTAEIPRLKPLGLAVLCATIFCSVTNASMSSIALPDIARDFGVPADDLSWVVTAFIIPFATGTVIYGRLADTFGTKRMYLFGLSVFAAASFVTAAAPGFGWLVAARALQGVGATAVPALSMATIIRSTDPVTRGRSMGATVMTVGLGFATGPLLGGWLVDLGGWPGPFLAVGIGVAVLIPLAAVAVPGVPGTRGERFDLLGAILVVLSITGAVIALNRLPRGVTDGLGLAGLGLVAVLLPLAVLRLRFAATPFIHRAVSSNIRFWALSTIGFTAQGTHFAVVVLVPLLLTTRFGASTIEVGLWMLPGALAIAAFGLAGGQLLERLGARLLLIAGALVMASGGLVFHAAGAGWQAAGISLMYAWIAAGYGMLQSAVITAATGAVSEELAGMASGAFNLAFFLGGAVSVALSTAILRQREGADEAWNPLFDGAASAYSDALLVVVVYVLVGVVLAVAAAPRRSARPASAVELPAPGA